MVIDVNATTSLVLCERLLYETVARLDRTHKIIVWLNAGMNKFWVGAVRKHQNYKFHACLCELRAYSSSYNHVRLYYYSYYYYVYGICIPAIESRVLVIAKAFFSLSLQLPKSWMQISRS